MSNLVEIGPVYPLNRARSFHFNKLEFLPLKSQVWLKLVYWMLSLYFLLLYLFAKGGGPSFEHFFYPVSLSRKDGLVEMWGVVLGTFLNFVNIIVWLSCCSFDAPEIEDWGANCFCPVCHSVHLSEPF